MQLWIFIKQVLTADFGASWSTNEAVSHIMATRLGPSLTLLIPWLILSTLISIGLALAVAYVRASLTDRLVMISCTVGLSISILVYIIVFQYVFAYKLGWFPVQGWGDNFRENLFIYATLPIFIGFAVPIVVFSRCIGSPAPSAPSSSDSIFDSRPQSRRGASLA